MENRVRRALVSVFDKEGVVGLCREFNRREIEILSSGQTARLLREHGIPVVSVSDYTDSPELLDGRVKTLHPRIHAGILAVRSNPDHMLELERSKIRPIDLVVVNLYPFEKTAATPGARFDEVIEMIDIGGPAMVRAAAKNFESVGVVVDPADYAAVSEAIREHGALSREVRLRLALKAFAHTGAYDGAVHRFLAAALPEREASSACFPDRLFLDFVRISELRYGENPHQLAAFYRDPGGSGPSVAASRKVQGKDLSFNNILDLDAALTLVGDLPGGACAILKHGNPCGVALGPEPAVAFRLALECDPTSAFGGIIAFRGTVDRPAALAIAEGFYEGVIAPDFEAEALVILSAKKNLRVLRVGDLSGFARGGWDLKRVSGGLLVQDWDASREAVRDSRVVTRRPPSEDEWRAMEFAWTVARHVKSNAIVCAFPDRTVGIGAGQMSRVDSVRLALQKARAPLSGAVMASDAFFPFRDGVDAAVEAGVTAVVQPGGSVRDSEVIAAADEGGMSMVFTGRRHFRH